VNVAKSVHNSVTLFKTKIRKTLISRVLQFKEVVPLEGKSLNLSRKQKIIGSVALVDRARNVIMISKDPKTGFRNLTIEKSNNLSDEKKGKPIKLRFDVNSFIYSLASTYDVTTDINSETSLASQLNKKQRTNAASGSVKLKSRKNKPGRKLDDAKKAKAKDLRKGGYSIDEISEILGVHRTTVWRWLKEDLD
jgi:hypothetical protein